MQPSTTKKPDNTLTLPQSYLPVLELDLQKNKKTALLINGLALLIAVPLVILGSFFVPISMVPPLSAAGNGAAVEFCRRFSNRGSRTASRRLCRPRGIGAGTSPKTEYPQVIRMQNIDIWPNG